MRYMLDTPWGHFTEDGGRFEIDYDKLGAATGYAIDELKSLGILHCWHHPRLGTARLGEATAVTIAAALQRAA